MYKIWDEIRIPTIIFIVLGVIFEIVSVAVDKKLDYFLLLMIVLFVVQLITYINRYFSLKKNGTLLKDLPYYFKEYKGNQKILIIDLKLSNGNNVRLVKEKFKWGNVSDTGKTNVLINLNDTKRYFIFDPPIK